MRKCSKGIMDENMQSIIVSYAMAKYNDTQRANKLPRAYLDRMFSENKVYCFHCGEQIQIGEKFSSNRHSGPVTRSMRKYYHLRCWNKMFY